MVDLSVLDGLTELSSLNLSDCTGLTETEHIVALGGLTSLTSLDLSGTLLTSMAPLERLGKLASLNLRNCCKLTDLAPLKAMSNLRSLDIQGCDTVSDLSPLRGPSSLTSLVLYPILRA